MNFLQLEYFVEVAARGGVTKAAESLHISQSALSQTLRKLEGEFGVSFFRRRPAGLELTEPGEVFLDYARRALREREELCRRLGSGELRGEIVVQSNPVPYLIADHFLRFRQSHPGTEIRFVSVPELLINDYSRDPFLSVSLLVTTEPPVRSDTETRFLLRERFMAALPRSHPLAARESVSLRELCDEPFLIYEKGEVQRAVEHCCTDAGFTPRVECVCHDLGTMFSLVAGGGGVSLFPESWKKLCSENAIFVPLQEDCSRTIYLCWGKNAPPDAAAAAFRDYLIEKTEKGRI
ncbi:MAG: LysR family transcriptional regulator [Ruminococcaceae bacterium]|nr:LysR family transcriptional regulator [Oscillospiraceae bacterium]